MRIGGDRVQSLGEHAKERSRRGRDTYAHHTLSSVGEVAYKPAVSFIANTDGMKSFNEHLVIHHVEGSREIQKR